MAIQKLTDDLRTEIENYLKDGQSYEDAVETCFSSLSDGPTAFEKCSGYFGPWSGDLLMYMIEIDACRAALSFAKYWDEVADDLRWNAEENPQ